MSRLSWKCTFAFALSLALGHSQLNGQNSGDISPDDLAQPSVTNGAGGSGRIQAKLVGTKGVKVMAEDASGNRYLKIQYMAKRFSDDSLVRSGEYTEYYPNGQPFCRGEYLDGARTGEWTFWHVNGKEAKKGAYSADRPEATWMVFDTEGRKAREESYQQGVPHGPWREWHSNGQASAQWEFREGRRHGSSVRWDQNGKKVHESQYRDGQPVK